MLSDFSKKNLGKLTFGLQVAYRFWEMFSMENSMYSHTSACCILCTGFLFDLLFNPEDGDYMFL
jgi:hypothetical protein